MEDQSYNKALNTGVSDGTHSGNRGLQENYKRKANVQHEANKLGENIAMGVAALFLHPVFCFVGFWLIGFGSLLALAPKIGLHDQPTWYGWTAAIIPLVLAFVLRKIVPKLMAAVLVAVVVSLAVLMFFKVKDLREERAAKAAATPAVAAPAEHAASPRQRTIADIQKALIDAASPETTSTAPTEGPANEFETAYCTSVPAAERPDWCP
ncbi:MAG: hypothetical protein WBN40_11175 [Pseudomonadales bacterium]